MTTRVKGLAELQRMLDTLPPKIERNIMRGAMRAGAAVIMRHAKAAVPVDAGLLRESLRVSARARGGQVTATVIAGGPSTFYARFVEYGTKPHTITAKNRKGLSVGGLFFKSVDHPGARPRPFMRPAMDTQAQAALVAVGEYVKMRLTKQGLDASGVELVAGDDGGDR